VVDYNLDNKIDQTPGWIFKNDGSFELNNPTKVNYLYFPLTNEAGMISSITPTLHGDAKVDQNTFLLRPCSVEDLHNTNDGRNFWIKFHNGDVWSVAGNSAMQKAQNFSHQRNEKVSMEAGFLWHRILRENEDLGVKAVVTNFVPIDERTVELLEIHITNISDKSLIITPIAAIPIFGRSADNLRDHRHVTSLLHRIYTTEYGVQVHPTMHFDERGHQKNEISYAILGSDNDECPPIGFFPIVEDFIGEGGNLDWPKQVVDNDEGYIQAGKLLQGYEAIGGLRFKTIELNSQQSVSFRLVLSIYQGLNDCKDSIYLKKKRFAKAFDDMKHYWDQNHQKLQVYFGNQNYNHWVKWVTIQPVLRRIMGNSFLPYHDYGRGGRGWRDLWQDCLSLLFLEPSKVHDIILKSFAGVRIDGSNATIIGKKLGQFKADRNEIARVWMDHGAWPFITTKLYIDQTGDLELLLEEQDYFRDKHVYRCKQWDTTWYETNGTKLLQYNGLPYRGTILEHILVQHLTSFFHVGEHNIFLLDSADWNDGLDMASNRGESVAFTALYANNLSLLFDLLKELQVRKNIESVSIAEELLVLFDTLQESIDYDSVEHKRKKLDQYFSICIPHMSGEKVKISLDDLLRDLKRKTDWLKQHIRKQEWITNNEGFSWFNGYYNDQGCRLEGDHPSGVRMTLSGQVFTSMSGIANKDQLKEIIKSVENYLWDTTVGGVRMNTNFNEFLLNMGRSFAFAYGHKENGAMFSHLAMMFAYALYERRESEYAYKITIGLYNHCQNFEVSRIYPGIPEYINQRGRGMYTYLTGSASWYLLTIITKIFGVRGNLGDLVLDPQLRKEQFNAHGTAKIITIFDNKRLELSYHNPKALEPEEYQINSIEINENKVNFKRLDYGVLLEKTQLTILSPKTINKITVSLGKKE